MQLSVVLLAACALLASFAAATIAPNTALSVRILAHRDECFYEDVNAAGTKVFFHFMVTNGGALDIDASVYGPDAQLLWTAEKESESRVLFKAHMPGQHKFCFSNKMSTITQKTVTFSIQAGDPAEDRKGHSVDPFERSLIHIGEGLTEIKNEQTYLRTRERVHRDTAESTNTRVVLWTVVTISTVIGVGVCQIMYLKSRFEKRRFV
jgi:protein ERP2